VYWRRQGQRLSGRSGATETTSLDKWIHFVDSLQRHPPVCKGFGPLTGGELSTKR
jgi:hypothetical protein